MARFVPVEREEHCGGNDSYQQKGAEGVDVEAQMSFPLARSIRDRASATLRNNII